MKPRALPKSLFFSRYLAKILPMYKLSYMSCGRVVDNVSEGRSVHAWVSGPCAILQRWHKLSHEPYVGARSPCGLCITPRN